MRVVCRVFHNTAGRKPSVSNEPTGSKVVTLLKIPDVSVTDEMSVLIAAEN
jgi:hypothetical protein